MYTYIPYPTLLGYVYTKTFYIKTQWFCYVSAYHLHVNEQKKGHEPE